MQFFQYQFISLDDLGGCKSSGYVSPLCVILDYMLHGVYRPVNGSAVVVLGTEVLPLRPLLIFCDMDSVIHKFRYALILGS